MKQSDYLDIVMAGLFSHLLELIDQTVNSIPYKTCERFTKILSSGWEYCYGYVTVQEYLKKFS